MPRLRRSWSIAGAIAAVFVAALVTFAMIERGSHEHDAENKTASSGAAPVPKPDDRPDRAVTHIRKVLGAFTLWSPSHSGAPCPGAGDLATILGGAHEIEDPWGHPIAITCTDQPAKQIIGVISAGPDGRFTTSDDVVSWTLGPDTTSLVQGTRWATSTVTPTVASPTTRRTASHGSKYTARPSTTNGHQMAAPAGSASAPPAAKLPTRQSVDTNPATPMPPPDAQGSNGGIPRSR